MTADRTAASASWPGSDAACPTYRRDAACVGRHHRDADPDARHRRGRSVRPDADPERRPQDARAGHPCPGWMQTGCCPDAACPRGEAAGRALHPHRDAERPDGGPGLPDAATTRVPDDRGPRHHRDAAQPHPDGPDPASDDRTPDAPRDARRPDVRPEPGQRGPGTPPREPARTPQERAPAERAPAERAPAERAPAERAPAEPTDAVLSPGSDAAHRSAGGARQGPGTPQALLRPACPRPSPFR